LSWHPCLTTASMSAPPATRPHRRSARKTRNGPSAPLGRTGPVTTLSCPPPRFAGRPATGRRRTPTGSAVLLLGLLSLGFLGLGLLRLALLGLGLGLGRLALRGLGGLGRRGGLGLGGLGRLAARDGDLVQRLAHQLDHRHGRV